MSGAGPDGLGALRDLADRRPDLAGRVGPLVEGLARIGPQASEPDYDRAAGAVAELRHQGVLYGGESDTGPNDRRLSLLALLALERATAPGFGPPRLLVGNAAAELAAALGRAFETAPVPLLQVFQRVPAGEWDFPQQVAWVAARRGGDALVAALGDALEHHSELALDFLEAAVAAELHGPYRGAPPLQAERPSAPPPEWEPPNGETPPVPAPAPPPPAQAPPAQAPQEPKPPPAHAPQAPAPEPPPRPPYPMAPRPAPPAAEPEAPVEIPTPRSAPPPRRSRGVRRLLERMGEAIGGSIGSGGGGEPAPRPMGTRGVPPPAAPRPAVVSTGFTHAPGRPGLAADTTLARGRLYRFFVEIAPELTTDALDTTATPLPELPAGTVLQVALFGFNGELAPEPGADVGELRLVGDGSAVVERQPGGPESTQTRLHLAVRTPDRPGPARMRCNLYCRQVLLQSRLVEVEVSDEERSTAGQALRVTLDFAVVSQLKRENLEALQARALSLLVNDNGNGTHGFRFFAGTEFKHDATLSGDVLGEALEQARAALRLASWATLTEPTRSEFATLTYRYSTPTSEALAQDLVTLARSGFLVWDVLVDQLSDGQVDDLMQRMRAPGVVELANKESLDLLVPAACIYDHPLNPEDAALTVCPSFLTRGTAPIEETPCFQGACPSYDDPTVVCPSGFWGFRHQIGYAASLTGGDAGDATDQTLAIPAGPAPVFTAGASADTLLSERDAHLARVRQLAGDQWHFAWSRTDLFGLFRSTAPSVVYLYGHGGKQGRSAFFEVGDGQDGPIIRASLRGKADWRATRPLVFLNGCHSAALAPDAAFSYATGFLQTAHASAVIGTEIAVFEKLATAFAEDCLRRFVAERQPLGLAVRGARLALLERGIPLGLVYLAFGPSELHLAD